MGAVGVGEDEAGTINVCSATVAVDWKTLLLLLRSPAGHSWDSPGICSHCTLTSGFASAQRMECVSGVFVSSRHMDGDVSGGSIYCYAWSFSRLKIVPTLPCSAQ